VVSPALVLLPSPLLGPVVWQPVAEVLSSRGWAVVAVPPTPPVRTPEDVLDWFLGCMSPDADRVLIPHSNAGLYAPLLAVRSRVAATVFVDAGLPGPNGRVPLAPPELVDFLRARAGEGGLLPRWTDWWDPADVAALFPGRAVRERVERVQQRLPVRYFEHALPVPPGWDDRPAAYLAFGDTYTDERAAAAERGWPTRTMPGRHLHMLVAPAAVATQIEGLLTEIGVSPPTGVAGGRPGPTPRPSPTTTKRQ
jgi:hypothetical protein